MIYVDNSQSFSSIEVKEKTGHFLLRSGSGVVIFQKLRQSATILEDSQQENKGVMVRGSCGLSQLWEDCDKIKLAKY